MDFSFQLGDTGTISTSFIPDGAGGKYSFVDSEVLSGWFFFYMTINSSSESVIGQFRNDPAYSMYSNQVLDPSHAGYHKTLRIGVTDDTVTVIDNLLDNVNSSRGKLGALGKQLLHAMNSMSVTLTNTEASLSTILDIDCVDTTPELARAQIMQRAATAMLAQATSAPEALLRLLGKE